MQNGQRPSLPLTGREGLFSRTGWSVLVLLILFAPLIQGGSPRLPTALIESAIFCLVILWGYEWGWKAPCQSLRITIVDALLGLFLFWAVFSVLFAPYQHSAEKAFLFLFCCLCLYWWLVFHPSLKGLGHALTAVTLQGLFQSFLAWYQWGVQGALRPAGTFHNPNFLAAFLAAAIILTLGTLLTSPGNLRRRPLRSALIIAAVTVMTVSLLLTGSRGGVLALSAGLLVLAGRNLLLSLAGAGCVLLGLIFIPNPWTERITSLARLDVYAYSRVAIWKSALSMMRDHPWLGIGLGQYKYFSPRYAFPVDAHWARYGRVAEAAHSEYLQVGAELGLPGLLVVLAILLTAAACVYGSIRRGPADRRAITVVLFSALVALLVHASVDFPLQTPPPALLLVLLAAALRIHGCEGPSWIVEFRFRKVYGTGLMVLFLFAGMLALRPVAGFWHFLGGLGAPQNLMQEKWSLEKAPKETVNTLESIRFLERAAAVDPRNAAYHNALGSRYFRVYLHGEGKEDARRKGLYHANYAAALNPNSFRYAVSLGQAMESLSLLQGDPSLLVQAAGHYRRALSLAPKKYSLHEKSALLAEKLGDLEEAERGLRETVRLEPNYLKGWYNLGTFLARQGRMEESLQALVKGRASAGKGLKERAASPYERTLVDFDVELFENRIEEIRKAEAAPLHQR